MARGDAPRRPPHARVAVLAALCLLASRPASAQDPPPDSKQEARIRELEATVQKLSRQVEKLTQRLEEKEGPSGEESGGGGSSGSGGPSGGGGGGSGSGSGSGDGSGSRGGSGAGPITASERSPDARMPPPPRQEKLRAIFGGGFELATEDDEFTLQFHNLTQIDATGYARYNQLRGPEVFSVPLGLAFFGGRLTRQLQYSLAMGEVFGRPNVYFAYLNWKIAGEKLQFRFGRQKQPFTYEWYEVPLYGLINVERSMFFNNFGGFVRDGAMLFGGLFDNRLEYDVGIFDAGQITDTYRFLGRGRYPTLIALIDTRPFGRSGDPALEHFHFGGTVMAGARDQTPEPQVFWSILPTGAQAGFGTPFLALNDDVRAMGDRVLATMHAAYYYRQLSVIGEWQGGFLDYGVAGRPGLVRVPINGFYAQAGYFLTGETIVRRDVVEPFRPLDLRPGHFGLGAFELAARYNLLEFGRQVFTGGLADPNLWTDRAQTVDLGVNWYWSRTIKTIFDWQHAMLGSPVSFAPGRFHGLGDTFVFRLQIWF